MRQFVVNFPGTFVLAGSVCLNLSDERLPNGCGHLGVHSATCYGVGFQSSANTLAVLCTRSAVFPALDHLGKNTLFCGGARRCSTGSSCVVVRLLLLSFSELSFRLNCLFLGEGSVEDKWYVNASCLVVWSSCTNTVCYSVGCPFIQRIRSCVWQIVSSPA